MGGERKDKREEREEGDRNRETKRGWLDRGRAGEGDRGERGEEERKREAARKGGGDGEG